MVAKENDTPMNQRVLFVVTYFDCGGINRSLQNLLNSIDVSRYDIDVFGMVPDGMFRTLYNNCHVLPRRMLLSSLMARYAQQKGTMRLLAMLVKVLDRATKGFLGYLIKKNAATSLMRRGYDTIVAFSEGAPTAFVKLMNHSNSVAWIHCDYSSYEQMMGGIDERLLYSHFKNIVCVAEYPRQSFLSIYPELASRTKTIYNIMDVDMMNRMSEEEIPEDLHNEGFIIVSVGRLDFVKRLSKVPTIAKRVVDAGCKFKWYIIGPKGGTLDEYNRLMSDITDLNVSEEVIYLGEKENPYAYIARADLLVNISISEACPYVINEAMILHTPVVCTNFGSASEFVNDGDNGFIRPLEAIADTIINYINDKELEEKIKRNLSGFLYDNKALLKQIYQIID